MTKRRTANGGIAGCAEKRADAARQYLDRFDGHDWVLLYWQTVVLAAGLPRRQRREDCHGLVETRNS